MRECGVVHEGLANPNCQRKSGEEVERAVALTILCCANLRPELPTRNLDEAIELSGSFAL